jgi:hypothetical protein
MRASLRSLSYSVRSTDRATTSSSRRAVSFPREPFRPDRCLSAHLGIAPSVGDKIDGLVGQLLRVSRRRETPGEPVTDGVPQSRTS